MPCRRLLPSALIPAALLPAALLLTPAALGLGLPTPPTPAQTTPVQPRPAPPTDASRFAAEPFVIQSAASVTTMHADGTGTRLQTFSVRIQSESALRSFGIVSVTYPKNTESADFVYARVLHTDGTRQETPTSDTLDQPAPVTREAPFYSDLQVKQLPLKNLRVGDTLEWQARSTILHPEAPGQFWGQDTFLTGPVSLNETVELRTPLTTHPTVWTNPRAKATFLETTEGTERVDRWTHSSLAPTVGPVADAARLAEEHRVLTPDEELDNQKGKLPDLAWTTFPDWAAVGDWYRSLAVGRATPDPSIQARVAELTAGKLTDLSRAQALYAYVSSQIRYIGVAFGIGRYQPHLAADVLSNQYGDCKDKHTLLASMLAAAGLHADPVLIGAGIRFNPAVPSPSAFNHLITRLTLDGQPVWLDSTTEGVPWRALFPVIRDQQALDIPPTGPATIVRTPADLPYPATVTAVVVSTLDPSLTSDSRFTITYHDDTELPLRAALRAVSPADYGAVMQRFMAAQGFGGTTSEPAFDNLNDSAKPLTLLFHYHRIKQEEWGENRVTVPFLSSVLPAFAPEKPPTSTIELGTPRTETTTVELTLPPGWQVELPAAIHAASPFAICDTTYRRDAGKLYAERKLTVLQKELPVSSYKQYQAWYDAASAGSIPYLQLTPPVKATASTGHTAPNPPTAAATTTPGPSNPEAAKLVQQAIRKLQGMDPDAARKLLDQARALNPTERGLWLTYGGIAESFGAASEALDDMQREVTYHPDEIRLLGFIAQMQARRGDPDAAIATARKWTEAAPDSPEAALLLVQQLSFNKQYPVADTTATAALTRLRAAKVEDQHLTPILLAQAGAQTHIDKLRAAHTVASILPTLTDPSDINNAAYILAESNTDLPMAETAMRSALTSLDGQTTGWAITDTVASTAHLENSLAAAWDTLGWILFREGKPADALPFLEAAATILDHEDVRDHLTAVATALHRPALAHLSDQQRRTIPLGAASGRHGTAELQILLVDGKLVDTAPGTAPPTLNGAADLLKSADLHRLLPPSSAAHLLRVGIVNCHGSVCELVLIPVPAR